MGSFSRVAAERSMSPASIMKQMNVLEQRIGATLLRRTTHGIELTEAGQYLYSRAKELVAEADAAVGLARQIDGRNTRTIRIGSSLLRPGIVLTELWDQLCPDGGGYRFRLVPWDDDRDRVLSVIASLGRQTDFLVGAFLSRQMLRLARFCPLGTYNLCVAVPRSHRLAGRDKLTLEDLHGERLYMVKGGDIPQLCRLRDTLRRKHPDIRLTDAGFFYDRSVFRAREGSGGALLTLDAWADVSPGLVTLPVDWDFTVPYGILYAPQTAGPAADFLQALQEKLGEKGGEGI